MIIDIYNSNEYRNYIDDIIINYCIDNNIDTNNIYPTMFNDILLRIYEKTYAIDKELLCDIPNINNAYNPNKIMLAYNVFYSLCSKYCMEISQKRFLLMTGINKQTLYNWRDGKPLSCQGIDLYQKILEDNEESLSLLMQDRRNNPMKYLPKLNKVHEWNMPGVRSAANKTQSIGFSDLPQLSENNTQFIETNTE